MHKVVPGQTWPFGGCWLALEEFTSSRMATAKRDGWASILASPRIGCTSRLRRTKSRVSCRACIAACWQRTGQFAGPPRDRKSTRLNSSHRTISYAVFCLKKKKKQQKTYNYMI